MKKNLLLMESEGTVSKQMQSRNFMKSYMPFMKEKRRLEREEDIKKWKLKILNAKTKN